jgi:hypothetical protein
MMQLIFLLLLATATVFALLRGGPSERAAALIVLIAAVVSPLEAHDGSRLWHGTEVGILAVDGATLAAFVTIMLLSTRFWPIWAAAFQLLTVVSHVGPVLRVHRIAIPFALEEELWSWIILVQLIFVTHLRSREASRPRTR